MNRRWVFFTVCWLALVVGGTAILLHHSQTPGKTGDAPEQWPAASRIPRAAARPTLVMFAHPKCPCTRASIGELAILMEKNQGLLDARVVFFQPEEAGEDWAQTDTWQKAAGIPGVTVQTDIEGREAWTFGATTSGQVVLYDAQGRLCFSGGITGARGHSGDNEGRTVIGSLLRQEKTGFAATQVFGCPILDAELTGPTAKTP